MGWSGGTREGLLGFREGYLSCVSSFGLSACQRVVGTMHENFPHLHYVLVTSIFLMLEY